MSRLTNFSSGVASFGVPVMGDIVTFGDVYFVDYRNGSDGNSGKERDQAFKTLSYAESKMSSNANDVVYIDGDQTVTETAMITWDINRGHAIGCNGPMGHYGAGAKVSVGVTTASTDIGTFKVTGVRNTFSGIKFMNSNTVAQGVYCLVDAGEYSRYFGCEIYKSTDLDQAAAAEVIANGDSSMFYNCTFGSLVDSRTAAGARPNILIDREIVSGKVCRDNYFENCLFLVNCGNTGNHFVYATASNDAERMVVFNRCMFITNPLSAATMTDAIDNNTTNAVFLLIDCVEYGATNFCADADTTTYILGNSPTGTTAGIAVEASAA